MAVHPGIMGATVPYLGVNLRAEAAPAHLKVGPHSTPSTTEGLLEGLPVQPIHFYIPRTPQGATPPPGSETALEGFHSTSRQQVLWRSLFMVFHKKVEWLTLTDAVRQQTWHCPFTQGLSHPAPLHRRNSVFIKVPQSPKCCTDLSRQFKVEWVKTLFPSEKPQGRGWGGVWEVQRVESGPSSRRYWSLIFPPNRGDCFRPFLQ